MFRRVTLFLLVNILIITLLSILVRLLGLEPYLYNLGLENLMSLAIFCLVWGMGGSFISLFLSKFFAKMFMGVKIVPAHGPYSHLVQSVHRMAKSAGLEVMPEVGIYHSPEINAFATGPTRSNSLVAVSTGLLERMRQDEVEGVIGHEVGHIANGDMVTMTLLQGVINAFVMFAARVVAFIIDRALRSGDGEGRGGLGGIGYFFTVIVFQILFGILGSLVVAAFSRWREFRADAASAKLSGRQSMINALKALQRNYEMLEDVSMGSSKSQMNAFKISSRSGWMSLFSTHPPLKDRIAALEKRW